MKVVQEDKKSWHSEWDHNSAVFEIYYKEGYLVQSCFVLLADSIKQKYSQALTFLLQMIMFPFLKMLSQEA